MVCASSFTLGSKLNSNFLQDERERHVVALHTSRSQDNMESGEATVFTLKLY